MDGSERYVSCMREIKNRVNIIKWMIHIEMAIDHKLFQTEFISLQFRSIIELILLANLSAHKTLYDKGCEKLKNEWRIKSILQFLKSVNTDFYPLPVTETFSEENPDIPIYLSLTTDFLSLEDLEIIYDTCSKYIHPKNPFAEERNYKIKSFFSLWLDKIENLLRLHTVLLADTNWCLLISIDFFNKNTTAKNEVKLEFWRKKCN